MLVAYSASWPLVFEDLRQELLPVFAGVPVDIAHIGSTSVPGLAAKPVIDLLLGAPTLAEIETRIADIMALAYEYRPHYEAQIPQRRYFVKTIPSGLRIHVHGVETGGRIWLDHLRFRDLLRTDDTLRVEYEALKQRLAVIHANDKATYTVEKGVYIQSLLSSLNKQG